MKLVTTQPTSGQFVAVWEYNGVLWSDTYMWEDGKLYQYAPDCEGSEDEWLEVSDGLVILTTHQHLWNYIVK